MFPETFLKCRGGVTGLGTHISPNHLLEWDYLTLQNLGNSGKSNGTATEIWKVGIASFLVSPLHFLRHLQHSVFRTASNVNLERRDWNKTGGGGERSWVRKGDIPSFPANKALYSASRIWEDLPLCVEHRLLQTLMR